MPKSYSNATKFGLVFLFKSLQQYSWINLQVPNSAGAKFCSSGSLWYHWKYTQSKDGGIWLPPTSTSNICENERHLKQGSEFKANFTYWSWKKQFVWILANRTYTALEIRSDVHIALFLLLCVCCPPHQADHFIKLNWFGYACSVLKGMHVPDVIRFGYAPVAVKGTWWDAMTTMPRTHQLSREGVPGEISLCYIKFSRCYCECK